MTQSHSDGLLLTDAECRAMEKVRDQCRDCGDPAVWEAFEIVADAVERIIRLSTPMSEDDVEKVKQAMRDATPSSVTCPSDFHLDALARAALSAIGEGSANVPQR